MTKGSLVVFEAIDEAGLPHPVPGIVIKGPYGYILSGGSSKIVRETKVADVLFGARLIKKIPIQSLRVIK
jgi:hypothetical protein